ncbi:hypothetical protein QCA50_005051 [Cerrena zonata]|uniref:PB1 domain-containing protein n=1 Tax=Cerrena zonata TaxID=2478898 RepID=A0AAW0GIL5_9APHY
MSLKAELETWAAALKAYDDEDFEKSLELFNSIGDSSKILVNMGLIYATLGEHDAAVEQFVGATQLDQYLSVAYFQCGVSNFLLQRYEMAYKDFDEALLYLRGNQSINYEQLGLKFKLFSAEVLFNKGLSQIYMGRLNEGLMDMEEARKEKATEEHNVIDDAINDRGDGYTVFSIPVGVLYRPSENKLKNAKAKDYMGKAKLVATSDANEAYTTFTGVTRLKQGITPANTVLDEQRSPTLTRAATVSVTSRPSVPDADRPQPALQRAKTTITVPPDARDRIRNANSGGNSPVATSPSLSRSNTANGRNMPLPPPPGSAPVRGLSVRRPGQQTPNMPPMNNLGVPGARTSPTKGPASSRVTEFYDEFVDSYGAGTEDMASPPGTSRVSAWARNNANPATGVGRARSTAPSSYAPSSFGTGVKRRVTRRGTTRASSRAQSMYEEEEEGYGSGGDILDDDIIRIRVKVHYQDDVRGMAIDSGMPFEEFVDRLTTKFEKSFKDMGIKFKDEDGGRVTLRDDMDYELAIETARESAKGKTEGRLELWCTDK